MSIFKGCAVLLVCASSTASAAVFIPDFSISPEANRREVSVERTPLVGVGGSSTLSKVNQFTLFDETVSDTQGDGGMMEADQDSKLAPTEFSGQGMVSLVTSSLPEAAWDGSSLLLTTFTVDEDFDAMLSYKVSGLGSDEADEWLAGIILETDVANTLIAFLDEGDGPGTDAGSTVLSFVAGDTYRLLFSAEIKSAGDPLPSADFTAEWWFSLTPVVVPEPGTYAMLGAFLGIAALRRNRQTMNV